VDSPTAQRFRELVGEQLPRLYSLARRLVGDDAEDAVQDCLLKGFQRFHQLAEPAAGPAWLKKDPGQLLPGSDPGQGPATGRDRFRRGGAVPPVPQDRLRGSDSLLRIAGPDLLAGLSPQDIRDVLMRLPDRYRAPLVLVYMEGYLAKEVAQMLGVAVGTVLSRLHRGRKLFGRQLWDHADSRSSVGRGR
jgi:RNA polymerase sigma-70 factor, ECF subfamily